MLYRKRTLDGWKALPSEQQISIARGRACFGFVADKQATKDARLGAAVRAALVILIGRDSNLAADMKNYADGVMYESQKKFFGAVADALAAEEAGNG